jgi:hypothetical protein
LDYLIGEKLLAFVLASERDPELAAELPAFVAEIRGSLRPGAHQVPCSARTAVAAFLES